MYTGMFTVSFLLLFVPLLISWEPIQLVLGTSILVKLLSGFLHAFILLQNGSKLVSTLMVLFTSLENVLLFTEQSFANQKSFANLRNFSKSYKCFRMYRVISTFANSLYTDFLVFLIAVGIVAASVSTYVTIMLYNSLSFVVFVMSPTLAFNCYVIAILLTMYANIPRKNGNLFCDGWKCQLVSKLDQKILKRCPRNIAYNVGPYGLATAKLGILICDDIVKNAIRMI